MRPTRWRRWSRLGELERVEVYTRQSLQLTLWGLCGWLVAVGVGSDVAAPTVAVTSLGAVVVTVLGTRVLTVVFRLYPATGPLPRPVLAAFLLVTTAYTVAVVAASPDDLLGIALTVALSNLAWAVGGLRDDRVGAGVVVVCAVVLGVGAGTPLAAAGGLLLGVLFVFAVRASLWLYGVVAELDSARLAQSRLAVAEERLRFSRDVHDVLGRRLSAIAVKSELAATLAGRHDDRAAAQMLEVRGVAHETLREARELARGYRPTDLGTELEGARSLLRSAGLEVRLDVGTVPRAWHEAAGWVVRESVTNVLRHSDARLVQISYADDVLRVVDDGEVPAGTVDPTTSTDGGSTGLRDLRGRLGALGATLAVATDAGGWAVTAWLPGSGPLGAAASAAAGGEGA